MEFLQKPLAWFSKFYLCVQSKNFGRNSFLIFLFRIFSDFVRNFFQTSADKSSKSCQNYLLRVQRNNLWLEIFFKSFESFWIFCRNLWHGSQIFIYVSRVKIAEETVFWFFFSELFRILRENVFRLSAKKRQEFIKTTFYVSRGTICGLNFFKFWIVSDFLQKPLAWFSKFYLRVQSKNCGKNSFFCFSFHNYFSNFERYIFWFLAKTLQKFSKLFSACPEEPFVPLIFFLKVLNRYGISAETFGMVLKFLSTCPE